MDSQDALESAISDLGSLAWNLRYMTKDHKRLFLKFVRDLMEAELKEDDKQCSKAEDK